MKHIVQKNLKKGFFKNVIILVSGTAGAQVIAMIFSPIITRIYGPDAYGIFGSFQALVQIITPIAALTYLIAIVLPKEDGDAIGLVKLFVMISLYLSIITLLIIIFFKNLLIKIFNIDGIELFIFFIPLVILFSGLVQVMRQWLIRTKQFVVNARVTFLQSFINNLSKTGMGLFYPYAIVLISIQTISNFISFILLYFLSNKKAPYLKHNKNTIRELSKKYSEFPKYRAPQELLNGITNGVPTLMLTAFFGPASAGFYTIGRTVLRLPTRLIGDAVGDVFYPHITEAFNNGKNVTKLLRKASFILAVIGTIPFGLIVFFGSSLFSFVFGNDWYFAGEYARWIALWSYTSFFNRPSVRALATFKAQKFHLIYTV